MILQARHAPLGDDVINVVQRAAASDTLFNNDVATRVNNQDITIMCVEGRYYWHTHPDSDEMFYLVDGELDIELRAVSPSRPPEDDAAERTVHLRKGDLFVVPQGTEHRSTGRNAQVMLALGAGALSFMNGEAKKIGGDSDSE